MNLHSHGTRRNLGLNNIWNCPLTPGSIPGILSVSCLENKQQHVLVCVIMSVWDLTAFSSDYLLHILLIW